MLRRGRNTSEKYRWDLWGRIIKSCYRDAVQKLEEENSKYDENFENSFVCQCIKEAVKTKEI